MVRVLFECFFEGFTNECCLVVRILYTIWCASIPRQWNTRRGSVSGHIFLKSLRETWPRGIDSGGDGWRQRVLWENCNVECHL